MARRVFGGGRVFDARSGQVSESDVSVDGGRIVDVGPGLDGDERIDVSGRTLLPGLFDCHTHVVLSDLNLMRAIQTPFSYRFYEAGRNPMAYDAGRGDIVLFG